MNSNDIQQKLALLPEGWAEENAQSWQDAIQYYQRRVFDHPRPQRETGLQSLITNL
jgi:hypothetical protein